MSDVRMEMDWDRDDVIKALRRAQKKIDELTIKHARYKATYHYATNQPLTDEEIIETCATWVVDDIGSDEVIKIVRRTELAHGIGEKDE